MGIPLGRTLSLSFSMFGIYILPTEEGLPPRALLIPIIGDVIAVQYLDGNWTIENEPVPADLDEAITQHALSLGVEMEGRT